MRNNELRRNLMEILGQYHRRDFLSTDPLEFVHRFHSPGDQESVGLLSALIAYGRVPQIRTSIEDGLSRMIRTSGSPENFVREADRKSHVWKGWVHRFNVGEDIALLMKVLRVIWDKYGSLGNLAGLCVKPEHPTIEIGLN